MTPFWFAMKVGAMVVVTAAGTAFVVKRLCPKPSDVVAGAIHLKRGMTEFQKGISTMFLGESRKDPEAEKLRKESARIHID